MNDDLDTMDVLDDRMSDKLEMLEQLESMKKAFKNRGFTEKEIKDLMRPHYKNIKDFY